MTDTLSNDLVMRATSANVIPITSDVFRWFSTPFTALIDLHVAQTVYSPDALAVAWHAAILRRDTYRMGSIGPLLTYEDSEMTQAIQHALRLSDAQAA